MLTHGRSTNSKRKEVANKVVLNFTEDYLLNRLKYVEACREKLELQRITEMRER